MNIRYWFFLWIGIIVSGIAIVIVSDFVPMLAWPVVTYFFGWFWKSWYDYEWRKR